MSKQKIFYWLGITLLLMLSVGCGKTRTLAELTGKVTYNGQPLQFGVVMIQAEGGQPATGDIQPDGTFEMTTRGEGTGVPVGECKVRILCFHGQNPEVLAQNSAAPLGKSLIPKRYNSFNTSGITVEIQSGANEPLNLKLTD